MALTPEERWNEQTLDEMVEWHRTEMWLRNCHYVSEEDFRVLETLPFVSKNPLGANAPGLPKTFNLRDDETLLYKGIVIYTMMGR